MCKNYDNAIIPVMSTHGNLQTTHREEQSGMNLRKNSDTTGRLLGNAELQRYLNLGRVSALKVAMDAGAVVRIGSRVLYDREKVDMYIDSLISPGQVVSEKE